MRELQEASFCLLILTVMSAVCFAAKSFCHEERLVMLLLISESQYSNY
jgi:hypothetical protein